MSLLRFSWLQLEDRHAANDLLALGGAGAAAAASSERPATRETEDAKEALKSLERRTKVEEKK